MKNIHLSYLERSLILFLFPVSVLAQPIIWEKVTDFDDKVNSEKTLKWEIIKEVNDEGSVINTINRGSVKPKGNIYDQQINENLINLGITVPTANTTKAKELKFYVDQVFPSKGGEEGGTGNQNYSGLANYGLKDNLMLGLFFSHSDDPLHKKINNLTTQPENLWFSYGGSLRWKLFNKNKFKFAIDNSLESWIVKSGGCNGHNCSGSSSNIFNTGLDAVRNENLVGSISTPFTLKILDKSEFTISPKITFLPEEQSNSFGSGEFYGVNTGIGMGVSYKPNLKFNTFNSIYLPVSGTNRFDENLRFNKAIIYTSGFNYTLDSKTAFEGYLTNSFGSTPSTSILTIPSDNTLIIGSRFIYTPLAKYTSKSRAENYSIDNLMNGLSITNSNLIKEGERFIDFNIDDRGSNWITLVTGLSNSFNFEVAYGNTSKSSEVSNKYANTYVESNSTNIRVGGKAILFSDEGLLNTGIRLSFGRSFGETWPGYLFSEITNSSRVNDKIIFNLSPKAAWTGDGNPFAIGTGIILKLNDYFHLIPESNIAISESESNWTIALRAIPKKNIYLDIYTSNALNFTDIGELLQAKSQLIGIKAGITF